MKQVININFQGSVVPIEVTAFEELKNYTESLRRYFANEEGRDEIINDIESRIAELFQERLKAGSTCITEDDVNAIIASMGRPEDFEEVTGAATAAENKKYEQQQKTTAEPAQPGVHKRLYRDENNKVLGGVCSGLANYFGVDPTVIRIALAVLVFAAGFGIITYLVLWIAVPSSATTVIGGSRKKFFRDPDNKIVAGVCSGIGNYFGINVWIPRVLFLLPFISFIFRFGHWGFYDFPSFLRFSFSPGSVIVYIILWLVIPEAFTTTEKLEMKGEKVDMNSIKNSVVEEMKGVGQRVQAFGEEAKTFAQEKTKVVSSEVGKVAKRSRSSLGDVISLVARGFGYFIIAVVGFAMVVGLFSLGIFSIGIFPLKDYVIRDGWQNAFAWGTLLFFVAVPIIGVITWIIRRIAKIKGKSKMVRWSFACLWIIGWACAIGLITSVGSDFRSMSSDNVADVALSNPKADKLELTTNLPTTRTYHKRWLRFEPFEGLGEDDTVYVRNVKVHIVKSTNDSFRVTISKFANGYRKAYADTSVAQMNYNMVQNDSILLLDRGIPINQHDKFRNQHVIIIVYVPVGKKIKVDDNIGWGNEVSFHSFRNGNNDWFWDNDGFDENWQFNTEYVMKADGLYTLDGYPAGDPDHRKRKIKVTRNGGSTTTTVTEGDDYRYDDDSIQPALKKIDSIKMRQKMDEKRMIDSLEKIQKKNQLENEKIEKIKEKMGDDNTFNQTKNPMDSEMLRTI